MFQISWAIFSITFISSTILVSTLTYKTRNEKKYLTLFLTLSLTLFLYSLYGIMHFLTQNKTIIEITEFIELGAYILITVFSILLWWLKDD